VTEIGGERTGRCCQRASQLTTLPVLARLKTYEQQLVQVQGALIADNDNEELINLEIELKNLISLTKQLLGQAESSTASVNAGTETTSNKKGAGTTSIAGPSHTAEVKHYAAGDECQAKYAVSTVSGRAVDGDFLTKRCLPFFRVMGGGIQRESYL
jgi:hypothetical protein